MYASVPNSLERSSRVVGMRLTEQSKAIEMVLDVVDRMREDLIKVQELLERLEPEKNVDVNRAKRPRKLKA